MQPTHFDWSHHKHHLTTAKWENALEYSLINPSLNLQVKCGKELAQGIIK
jgi:hypothetical protein